MKPSYNKLFIFFIIVSMLLITGCLDDQNNGNIIIKKPVCPPKTYCFSDYSINNGTSIWNYTSVNGTFVFEVA